MKHQVICIIAAATMLFLSSCASGDMSVEQTEVFKIVDKKIIKVENGQYFIKVTISALFRGMTVLESHLLKFSPTVQRDWPKFIQSEKANPLYKIKILEKIRKKQRRKVFEKKEVYYEI